MTLRKVCDVKNNKLVIELPEKFRHAKKVLVIVDDALDSRKAKLTLLKKAKKDPLFLADIKEINEDFNTIDNDIP